jgi:glycosyltransferase involved in cell wall biosynthesis
MPAMTSSPARPLISVIVPARNEEASLADCLESLVAQRGVDFEIIVVDDHSTDRTREIAMSFCDRGVHVIEAPALREGWTGKNNAITAGVRVVRGEWLLFTDADTVHLPESLARSVAEAREHHADMLSYSPEQIAVTFWERATMPVIFAELARQYSPSKVSDPNSLVAAANGQYILIHCEAYDAVGGHAAIAGEILEDVALAQAVKRSGRKILFRYAADAVRTRMYRNFAQLREGWTKNLALLFPNARSLAALSFLEFFVVLSFVNGLIQMLLVSRSYLPSASVLLPHYPIPDRQVPLFNALFVAFALAGLIYSWLRSARRTWIAHFPITMSGIAILGLPIFAYLLLRSSRARQKGEIRWKGRMYSDRPLQAKTVDLQALGI